MNRSRTRARTTVLFVTMQTLVMRAPSSAHAEEPRRTPAQAASNAVPAAPVAAVDPTMFALEGDGDGGPASAPAVAPPTPVAQTPSWRQTGSWGWLIVVTSVGLGIATTAYGLTLRCADDDTECRRHTALAIWGGVGIAALGSTFGIVIVQVGQARVNAKPALFAGDPRGARDATVRPLVPGLILDAQF